MGTFKIIGDFLIRKFCHVRKNPPARRNSSGKWSIAFLQILVQNTISQRLIGVIERAGTGAENAVVQIAACAPVSGSSALDGQVPP